MKDSLELAFLRGFKDAITSFNRLDRNLAYFIRFANEADGRTQDLLKILSYSYDKKLKSVRTIIYRNALTQEYGDFLEMAESCRRFRNRLVHGDWRLLGHRREAVFYSVPAPLSESGKLTIEQFLEQVELLNRADSLFGALREKHPLTHERTS